LFDVPPEMSHDGNVARVETYAGKTVSASLLPHFSPRCQYLSTAFPSNVSVSSQLNRLKSAASTAVLYHRTQNFLKAKSVIKSQSQVQCSQHLNDLWCSLHKKSVLWFTDEGIFWCIVAKRYSEHNTFSAVLEFLGSPPPLQLWTPCSTWRRSLGASVSSPHCFFLSLTPFSVPVNH